MIADLEACEIIAMPLAADAKLTIAERYAFFRAHVTEAERTEWRAEVREERERKELRASVMEWVREILMANVEYAKAHGFKDWDEFIQKYGAEAFLALRYVEIPALAEHAK